MGAPNRPSPKPKKQITKENPPKPTHKKDDKKVPDWTTGFLIVIITLVWVASFVVGLFNPKYQVPEQVNLLFSSMVGGLLLNAASKRKGGDDE